MSPTIKMFYVTATVEFGDVVAKTSQTRLCRRAVRILFLLSALSAAQSLNHLGACLEDYGVW